MRLSAVLSEVARNIRSGTTRAALLAAALAACVGGLMALDLSAIGTLQRTSLDFERSAAATRVLVAEGLIDGRDCDALAPASGALRRGRPIVLDAVPADPVPTYLASPGLATVLGLGTGLGRGVWLSREFAGMLGVGVGSVLTTSDGPMRIAGVFEYPQDGRDARLSLALVVPETPSARYDECWATEWPADPGLDDALRWTAAVSLGAVGALPVGQLNNSHGPAYDPHAAYSARVTRWTWLGAAALGAALGYGAVRRRRLEYASALHAGQPRPAHVLTAILETGYWVGWGALAAVAIGLVVAGQVVPRDPAVALAAQAPTVAAAGSAALLAAGIGILRVRGRHLFAYFKDR